MKYSVRLSPDGGGASRHSVRSNQRHHAYYGNRFGLVFVADIISIHNACLFAAFTFNKCNDKPTDKYRDKTFMKRHFTRPFLF